MNSRSFFLKPFPSSGPVPGIKIKGGIERRSNVLTVCYELLGPLAELGLPAPSEKPARRGALWEETCFEFFIAAKNSGQYWEFNLSPAGHWNIYRFEAYRQGMREEPDITSLPFSIERKPDSFRLSLEFDLDKIIPADQALHAAVSAVLKPINGELTYWALTHPGPQADFHRRDSFIIEL
jgi:hypothetical protein